MAKGNRKAYHGGVAPKSAVSARRDELIDWQALDNSNLNVVNRVGIRGNKHVGVSNV